VYYARALKGDRIELGNCGLIGAFSSDTTISTPVAINKGGTGQTTAQAALDALAAASGSLVQGDVFIVDASGNVVRLARGSDNQTLVMNGSNPNWETVSAGGATLTQEKDSMSSGFTTTSTDFTDLTGLTRTLSTITGGYCVCSLIIPFENSGTYSTWFTIANDGAESESSGIRPSTADYQFNMNLTSFESLDGSVITGRAKVSDGTLTINNDLEQRTATMQFLEIS